MRIYFKTSGLALLATTVMLTGCSTATKPMAYQGLDSSTRLRPNDQGRHGHQPYAYSAPIVWSQYTSFVLDPVVIYDGADNQFDKKVTEDNKKELASYMQEQFQEKLRQRYTEVSTPAANTIRVKLTLTGAKLTTPFLGPFTHVDIGGSQVNLVQAIRGKEGLFTGSVSYAVEIYDAPTNQLIKAYVDKQYPNALNLKATFGSLAASKTGIQKGADSLLVDLK